MRHLSKEFESELCLLGDLRSHHETKFMHHLLYTKSVFVNKQSCWSFILPEDDRNAICCGSSVAF